MSSEYLRSRILDHRHRTTVWVSNTPKEPQGFSSQIWQEDVKTVLAYLERKGVTSVAFKAPKSYAAIIFLLATSCKGTCFSFFPSDISQDEEQRRCDQIGCSHVITGGDGLLLSDGSSWGIYKTEIEARANMGYDYVYFSSGSTGQPKAIAGIFDHALEFVDWQRTRFNIDSRDKFINLTSPYFDVYLRDILVPFLAGADIYIPNDDDLAYFVDTVSEQGCTVANIVPTVSDRLIPAHQLGEASQSSMRIVFFAGEPLYRGSVDAWRAQFPQSRIVNLYGPTECTLASFWHEVSDRVPHIIPVGRPLPGVQYKIDDNDEVVISSPRQAAGYLAKDGLILPFSPDGFNTHDIGKNIDGDLCITGRSDSHIKILGEFVDLAEVERVVRQEENVKDTAIIVNDNSPVVFVQLRTVGMVHAVRNKIAQHLPVNIRSISLREVDHWPILPNGKKDRIKLARWAAETENVRHPEVIPQALTEPPSGTAREFETILQIVQDVLGVHDIGLDHDLFEYGLTSLDAVQIVANARRNKLNFDVLDIFEARSVANLIHHLKSFPESSQGDCSSGRVLANNEWCPLSPHQKRYARVYLPFGNRSWANMFRVMTIPRIAIRRSVKDSIKQLVQMHDMLRTVFRKIDGEIQQRTLSSHEMSESFDQIFVTQAQISELRKRSVDIETWPIIRVAVIEHQDEIEIQWLLHHLVTDGVSQEIFDQDLRMLFASDSGESIEPRPAYKELVALQSERDISDARSYWETVFATPYDHQYLPSVKNLSGREAEGYRLVRKLPFEFFDSAMRYGVTPFTAVVSRMFRYFFEKRGYEDLVIGTPASGRLNATEEQTIGLFISLVCIRCSRSEVTDTEAVKATFERGVQNKIVQAMKHQIIQFDEVMDHLGIIESEDRFPLTSFFASQVAMQEKNPPLVSALPEPMGVEVKFDVMVYFHLPERGSEDSRCGDACIEIQFRRSVFDDSELMVFADYLVDFGSSAER